MAIQPYLFFNGNCEEAIAFYSAQLGAKVVFKTLFKDAPPDAQNPAATAIGDKIMHATIQVGESVIFLSDGGLMSGKTHYSGFSLSLTAPDGPQAKSMFDALAPGGTVTMPFAPTYWSAGGFGMLTDKFGVPWMIMSEH